VHGRARYPKLEAAWVVSTRRDGKEKRVTTTQQGLNVCTCYTAVREHYNQAARSAATV
jgi:predicted MarR family transcription regulator